MATIKWNPKEEKKPQNNWNNSTLAKLGLLDSKCSNCGETLVDITELILRERKERAEGKYAHRNVRLPRKMHAYCENKSCQLRLEDIPFHYLLLIKDVDKLKENQQKILEMFLKNGDKNETYKIEEVSEVKEI